MDDYWMKHVHLKITDRCNAACPFCIEKDSHIKENKERFLKNVRRLITLDKPAEDDLLQQFKHYLFDNADLIEQVLKDYYVYVPYV